jgi:hypothetical protein
MATVSFPSSFRSHAFHLETDRYMSHSLGLATQRHPPVHLPERCLCHLLDPRIQRPHEQQIQGPVERESSFPCTRGCKPRSGSLIWLDLVGLGVHEKGPVCVDPLHLLSSTTISHRSLSYLLHPRFSYLGNRRGHRQVILCGGL